MGDGGWGMGDGGCGASVNRSLTKALIENHVHLIAALLDVRGFSPRFARCSERGDNAGSIAGVEEPPQPVTDRRDRECHSSSRDHCHCRSRHCAIAAAAHAGAEARDRSLCTQTDADGAKQITADAYQECAGAYRSIRAHCDRSEAAADRYHTAVTNIANRLYQCSNRRGL